MRILAIDYGEKRVGLALGDTETNLALPYGTLARTADEGLLEPLQRIVDEEGVAVFVVGEPIGLQGASSRQREASQGFANFLRQNIGLPVELIDERLTSQRADVALRDGSRRTRDELAAMFLLQDYLDRKAGK